jgi:ferrous iron transport protein A
VTAAELKIGESAEVIAVQAAPALEQRLAEFGLFAGETVELLAAAPLGDPLEFRLGETRISLRKSEALTVSVRPIGS